MKRTTYTMSRTTMYGYYWIHKETPGGKKTKRLTSNAQLFDDYMDGKRVQTKLKSYFKD